MKQKYVSPMAKIKWLDAEVFLKTSVEADDNLYEFAWRS